MWEGRSGLASGPYPLHKVLIAFSTVSVSERAYHEAHTILLFIGLAGDPPVRIASKRLPFSNQYSDTTHGNERGAVRRSSNLKKRKFLSHNSPKS